MGKNGNFNFREKVDQAALSKPLFSRMDKDIPSSIVVFLVALPLCLGIALASGAPLVSGLISGIIGGIVIGSVSHSSVSVSGPAASLTAVVLASIASLGSFDVFLMAVVLGGIFQFILGILKAGLIADYMPSNIIKGLLAAIGIILIIAQLPYAVGFIQDSGANFGARDNLLEQAIAMFKNFFYSLHPGAVVLSIISLAIIIFWEKSPLKNFKLLPPSLIVVILGVFLNLLFKYIAPVLHLSEKYLVNIPKIDRVSELVTFPDFNSITNPEVWGVAITITLIASIASLLAIEAADEIDPHKRKTPPNRELVAQGIGNTIAGLVGGIPLTSVIVRSSVNINAGAETKLSTILHGIFLLLSVLFLSSILNLIPLSSLAVILLVVGYKLASWDVISTMYKKGWNQFIPFVVTVVAIILTDLLIGIFIGSLVSIFFLLRSNYHNAFFIENTKIFKGETIRLELSNEVSFFNKASIKNSLWNVPQNSNVIIDATFSSYIDHDILEIFEDFKTTFAEENNINVSIIGLKDKYSAGKELDFVREDIEESKERSTPQEILDYLKEGNSRYVDGKLVSRRLRNKELMDFINSPPLATVVNCIDLREPLNVMMNTGIGDLIPIRAAGNLVDSHIIKSIEIACKQQGSRFILLMGNSSNKIYLEALNEYMKNGYQNPDSLIAEALKAQQIPAKFEEKDLYTYADLITRWSVKESQKRIIKENPYLRERISQGKLGLATAFFNRENGKIEFSELYDSATVS
ncbi:bifunctional SulP family inorganic anion transporter/carbonic anhydrase [Salegentibacter sp. BDJ18]|jgi:carbonic anhydrase|uniref:bifunctional SulP family inorganic anion transporter/carbonic anhydrase n=1 Tax=Salegentibacter sp. BDJ18 TaxID=2816376 RepID=UPI001AAFD9C4|nr:SulP family inorganic anion transporter [Salegentibacter sp. BDJ18]MBO2544835.1 bifunctional SulP family inorganic anion transporter/carbonic anhydrase [Salegentibacter sp. BDJ18]